MAEGYAREETVETGSSVRTIALTVTAGVFLGGVATGVAFPTLALPAVDSVGFEPADLASASVAVACLLLVNATLIAHD